MSQPYRLGCGLDRAVICGHQVEEQAPGRRIGRQEDKLGILAATDNHNATATADSESSYMGSVGTDREARMRLRAGVEVPGGIARGEPARYGPGGVAGVWAEAMNTILTRQFVLELTGWQMLLFVELLRTFCFIIIRLPITSIVFHFF